ncbi:hypothetical protein CLAFUW4_14340 [Fulvia fulva]|uniref:Uncharacterized protein n=1 Tax=Passalora fulva TaxID=5499 RepID=A0A9Q8PM46_PASFU|nr:uncharacterized protein CLAFUR5_14170 [Fulvia fulva]KAK4608914.1 hypothetical protein CLAFUR4_14338 [Fulvia fulva]KAK4609643.1 hypothetical protein CLAFUR0_14342 [Fulvia fulva]UJO24904.1 hypothetical protein CLAFUR5_14170 [Fulvia fulva]WPV22836.1 hypothetical protein CLAFUW4_14340 [Fulvia fulva]WPV37758.1 hypothetical protein CLAFUW7_14346 [Fulvia fulva]
MTLCKYQEQDDKFKARQPSSVKWQIIHPAMGPVYMDTDPLEENYISNARDARMACAALQEMLYSWQQGYLED